MKSFCLIFLTIFFTACIASAQTIHHSATADSLTKEINRLDEANQACLDEGKNNWNCSNLYYLQADSMLNFVYRKLRGQLNSSQFNEVKASQMKWLKQRDKEFAKYYRENASVDIGVSDRAAVTKNQEAVYVFERIDELIKMLK